MVRIELTAGEARVVRDLLDREHRVMIQEIDKAATRPFREELKHRADLLESALAKIGAALAAAGA